ncbi:metallophosphoesterase [Devosia sp. SD17-2]|jgi:3',5'-cyclic AMP phosphodiesterase CpdA|uniref:metallophosphoesterase n=1 Tax=Devosia sp. SD17-2 TaxID=2976459 RepID=UPI0023D85AA4|nr:metallophosphoesterase [Devosia sp. SD17-2]WEJ32746.1 metallophosphoesterase [Devosia sp. SD17-2]
MKIWIISDLHLDHMPWPPPILPDHDVLVIAGDVSNDPAAALSELSRLHAMTQKPIVFVPGNHDLSGGGLDAFEAQVDGPVVVLPAGQSVVIDGFRFVGATLWTDFAIAGDAYASQAWAARHMPEYQRVTGPDGDLLWPEHTFDAHALHRAAIDRTLAQPFDGPTVVVTHHAPSPISCGHHPGLEDAAYASDLSDLIRVRSPTLWIHGHIHRRCDYVLENTRIIANPRGYESDDWSENPDFDPQFVVEVGV